MYWRIILVQNKEGVIQYSCDNCNCLKPGCLVYLKQRKCHTKCWRNEKMSLASLMFHCFTKKRITIQFLLYHSYPLHIDIFKWLEFKSFGMYRIGLHQNKVPKSSGNTLKTIKSKLSTIGFSRTTHPPSCLLLVDYWKVW